MKALNHIYFKEAIFAMLKRPEMYAHDCVSLSEQVGLVYGFYCDCMGMPHKNVHEMYVTLQRKYGNPSSLLFGSGMTNLKELASMYEDYFYETHDWDLRSENTVPFSTVSINPRRM